MKRHLKQYAVWAGLALGATSLVQADTLVTFQVDMTQQIANNAFTPGVNVVNARGSFNGWGTFQLTNNPTGINTNLYTGTVNDTSDAPGGTLSYKYCIDSGGWETAGCGGDGNRKAGLPATSGASLSLPIVFFGDAEPSSIPVLDTVMFQVDMTQQVAIGAFTPGSSTVYVRGDLVGWGSGIALTNDPNATNPNLYSTVQQLSAVPEHLGHFKYFIDTGNNWENPAGINQDCTGNRFWNMSTNGATYSLPVVYFNDVPPAPPSTNTVRFQVDMSIQATLGKFDYTLGDTVECRGSFNNWNGGSFVLTNDPAAPNPNLFSGTLNIIVPPTGMTYKFWDSNARAGNNGYEAPSSTGGNNRSYTLSNYNTNFSLPKVFYGDLASTTDFLTQDEQVTFNVNLVNAVTTGGTPFDPTTQNVYINGDWVPWWTWDDPLQPYLPYQLTENPVGSTNYTITLTIPRGNALTLTYKYSVNGSDNELAQYVNHVRTIRQTPSYTMPKDKFGTQYTEPYFGQLTAAPGTAGHTAVSWVGLPGLHLQAKSSLSGGTWQDLFATDGTNWTAGYLGTNGFVSVTNWPSTSGQQFFRLIKP